MPRGLVVKMVILTPKELDEIVERSVKKALLDHEAERPLRGRVDGAVKKIVFRATEDRDGA